MEQEQLPQDGPATSSVGHEIWEWAKALFVAAAIVILIRWFLFAPFIVDGPSMEPNFKTGERLIVNKIIYDIRPPKRGEVIVFHAPAGIDYIKRVIGLPGETIKIENNTVYINGEPLDEPYLREAIDEYASSGRLYNEDYHEVTVPERSVFVMGDNRTNSTDSRNIGVISYDKIVGRADVIFWPLNKIGLVNH